MTLEEIPNQSVVLLESEKEFNRIRDLLVKTQYKTLYGKPFSFPIVWSPGLSLRLQTDSWCSKGYYKSQGLRIISSLIIREDIEYEVY